MYAREIANDLVALARELELHQQIEVYNGMPKKIEP